MIEIERGDRGKLVRVALDEVVAVRLPESPGTGYRWVIDDDAGEALAPVGSGYERRPDAAATGGGHRTFRWRATKAGPHALRLKLWRPWRGESSVVERFDVTLEVE